MITHRAGDAQALKIQLAWRRPVDGGVLITARAGYVN